MLLITVLILIIKGLFILLKHWFIKSQLLCHRTAFLCGFLFLVKPDFIIFNDLK